MENFGARVQHLRKQKGLTMRQLEEQARIPHGIVSRLERALLASESPMLLATALYTDVFARPTVEYML